MSKPNTVLLCGCGWLGQQLVTPLQHQHYIVTATSRSQQRLDHLINQGVFAAPFSLGEPFPEYLLFDRSVHGAIIMLPPGRRSSDTSQWEAGVMALVDTLVAANTQHIIFVSTTSVYGDSQTVGITESSPTAPATASAHAHVRIENYIRRQAPTTSSIVRPAGLLGADRHPINTLTGRQLSAPNKVVNLVHGEDVVAALLSLLVLGPQTTPLLLCSLEHPQRKAYYDWSAQKVGIAPAQFTPDDDSLADEGKVILAADSWQRLGITPRYPSPFDML